MTNDGSRTPANSDCTAPPARRTARPDAPPVGQRLRALRRVRGVALKELAARAGVAYQTLQAVETKSDARLSTLQRLASALEVEVADLMDTARFNAALARAAEANLPD